MKIYIITFCRNIKQLYGNILTLRTIRTGFPNSEIIVFDNDSIYEARVLISGLAKENDCKYTEFNNPNKLKHWAILETIINSEGNNVIFLDPDLMFWESCEDWDFSNYLIAGRYLPKFYDEFSGCITYERIHTSFLWINNCNILLGEINKIKQKHIHFEAFMSYMFRSPDNGKWYRFDTLGSLYSVIKDKIYCFSEKELNSYSHYFFLLFFFLIRFIASTSFFSLPTYAIYCLP